MSAVEAIPGRPAMDWDRVGYGRYVEPETWQLSTSLRAGDIYATVKRDGGFWFWYVNGASSHNFSTLDDAKRNAEAYVRTHPALLKLN
jgi:hypothetical protein